MSEQPSSSLSLKLSNKVVATRYINLKSDFGFKFVFCKESHKDLLIDFLNGIFKGRKVIVDLEYNNPELTGVLPTYRKTIFDLYCTDNSGNKFIVEVQQAKQKFFKDRIIFYTANLIQEQGISVNAGWDYKLPEVYFIALMDFCFDDSHPDHYLHDVRLMEINSNKQFYNKFGYIFVELPKFKKTLNELETKEDHWLYSLSNMNKLKEIPLSLNKIEVFKKLFTVAEVSGLNQEEMNAYEQSLKIQRDNYSVDKYSREESRLEGRLEGMLEGKLEGKLEGRMEIALELKKDGMSAAKIAKITKLTIQEIEDLSVV